MMDLQGKRVVVLGGTSGIGLATARAAGERGAELIVASSSEQRVSVALKLLPDNASGVAIDVTDADAVQAFFAELGAIDHLVYTAGDQLRFTPLQDLDRATAEKFFRLRYFAALTAVRAAAPRLRAGGSITLTTGTAAHRPGPGWAAAASVCGAIEGLTRALAVELAPLRVNAVSPGVLRTPLWDALTEADRSGLYEQAAQANPVGRVGDPDDAAAAYLYLMTQRQATGTIVSVDGGSLLV